MTKTSSRVDAEPAVTREPAARVATDLDMRDQLQRERDRVIEAIGRGEFEDITELDE